MAGLLLAGGVTAAWPGTDWLKPRIARGVQRATGRALTIAGPLRVNWDLTVAASDVGLANMPGGSRPMMARAGRVQATFAFWPLLRGHLHVTALRLTDPRIFVERDAAGAVNWQLHKPAAAPSPGSTPASPGMRWDFHVDRLTTEGGSLAWHDARDALADGQRPMPVIDATFKPSGGFSATAVAGASPDGATGPVLRLESAPGQPFQADLAATVDGQALHATASVGTELLSAAPAPFRLTASRGAATATASGTIAPNGTGVAAVLAIRAPELGQLPALDGRTLPVSGALSLNGQLTATRQRVALTGLHVVATPGDVAGDLSWTPGSPPLLTANLVAQRLDLAALRAVLTQRRAQAAAPAGGAPVPASAPAASPLISDRPWPAVDLGRLDTDVSLHVATLINPDLRDVALRLLLHDGELTLDPFGASAGGRLNGTLRVDSRPPVPSAAMSLHAPDLAVASLLRAAHLPPVADGHVALDADLRANGRTPHEMAATLTGTARLQGAGVTVDAAALAAALRAVHLPSLGDAGAVPLRCLVVAVDAAHGQATVAPLMLDAGRVAVQGEGRVDLAAETLALRLRPTLRSGSGIVVPLRLSGGWRAPKLSSDFGAMLETGGLEPCAAQPSPVGVPAPPPATPGKAKPPKPIDILRGLLR